MKKEQLSFKHENGMVDGMYVVPKYESPLVVIVNGHNGFYNYGMFPFIQDTLANSGVSSYSFNFSHGGIRGNGDYFEDLDKYEQNCMRLEVEDTMCVLHNLDSEKLKSHSKIFLLAHSLGGVPAIFSASAAQDEMIKIAGIILVSTVDKLNFWPDEMLKEWEEKKVYYKKNNRTKQMLPQGEEFLYEVLQNDTKWNVKNELMKLKQAALIIHGGEDEAVSLQQGINKYKWIKDTNENAAFKIIPGATHTFNTRHPFEAASPQVEEMLREIVAFIQAN
ncbi:MAG: prolyl oligopeptidase family serine peptidase [Ginsengibacter sp.]